MSEKDCNHLDCYKMRKDNNKCYYKTMNLIPKELKHKKGIPTVIEYQGRRYILDHGNNK